jgi:hypothetical protein
MTKLYWFLLLLPFSSASLYGQSNTDTLISNDMTFELKNDTLYSTTGLKLFIGQKLTVGSAADEAGYYRSVISKKAAIVPSIWGQDRRYENAIENHVNKKKSREQVKKSLIPGNFVIIKRMGLCKIGKPYFYMVSLSSDADVFYCDIKLALALKELLLQP